MRPTLFAACAIAAVTLLAACSEDRITVHGSDAALDARITDNAATPSAPANVRETVAVAVIDDQSLGEIRGGLNAGSGMVVSFSFQEATYVNQNLTQSIAIPTLTISPGSNTTSVTSSFSPGALTPAANAVRTQLSSPAQTVQSIVNSGMTSVASNLGKGGITNVISNTASNQLIQQMITANFGITGLSQAMQQGVASTVMGHLAAANAQFH